MLFPPKKLRGQSYKKIHSEKINSKQALHYFKKLNKFKFISKIQDTNQALLQPPPSLAVSRHLLFDKR